MSDQLECTPEFHRGFRIAQEAFRTGNKERLVELLNEGRTARAKASADRVSALRTPDGP